jgi:hypothetical protein
MEQKVEALQWGIRFWCLRAKKKTQQQRSATSKVPEQGGKQPWLDFGGGGGG